jgi:hypothetical protein
MAIFKPKIGSDRFKLGDRVQWLKTNGPNKGQPIFEGTVTGIYKRYWPQEKPMVRVRWDKDLDGEPWPEGHHLTNPHWEEGLKLLYRPCQLDCALRGHDDKCTHPEIQCSARKNEDLVPGPDWTEGMSNEEIQELRPRRR